MLSDIENPDIMLGGKNLQRKESENSNSVLGPESPSYNALVNNDVKTHSNSRKEEIRGYAGNDQYSRDSSDVDSGSEI